HLDRHSFPTRRSSDLMKIVLPGGSGQVGQVIAGHFQQTGHDVVVLSRDPQPAPWRTVYWDGRSLGDWQPELEGADVVIGLAGKKDRKSTRLNSSHVKI